MRESKAEDLPELAPQLDDLMAASCLVEPKIEKLESAPKQGLRVFGGICQQ